MTPDGAIVESVLQSVFLSRVLKSMISGNRTVLPGWALAALVHSPGRLNPHCH